MEYTLQDAFETLKEVESERQKEIEDLMNVISKNKPVSLDRTSNSEDVRKKQHKLCKTLLNHVPREEPKDYPVPTTSDLHVEVLRELEEEVQSVQQLLDRMKTQLSNIKDDVAYLKNKKVGLEKMKEAYLGATESIANTTYNRECVITKRMFQTVKLHLSQVIDILFPENEEFKDFLAELTSAYTKGGDNLYVNVDPKALDCVNFLLEADIIAYHRNDKGKVRLMDML